MCIYIHIYVYIHVRVYVYMHTHSHIHIYIYLRGSLAFLPISQSEGRTTVVCILVEMDPGLLVSGSSLQIISVLPRGIYLCVETRKGWAWPCYRALPKIRPVANQGSVARGMGICTFGGSGASLCRTWWV